MNLLITATAYPPSIGGAQLLMHQLAREFIARHTVQVVSQWDTERTDWLLGTTLNAPVEPRAYLHDGVPVQRITLPPATRRRLAPWVFAYHLAQAPALARIAAALADEIEPFGASADVLHNCRIGREGLSFASWQVACRRGVPFVLTPVHHPRWGTWLHRQYHALYRRADAVIALTDGEKQALIRLGVPEKRVHVTGMGPVLAPTYDGQRFRDEYGLGADPMVLFLGQKYRYKGVGEVLRAAPLVWQRWPETRFVFIGPRTPFSRRLFGDVADQRILELGTVSLQAKTDALAACDLLCVPSTQESFGGVFTEAWSLGRPVIGADIPALRSVIDNGHTGLLVDQQRRAIAQAVLTLLEQPQLRDQMGREGRKKVDRCYSWPRLAQLTEAVYEQVLRGRQ